MHTLYIILSIDIHISYIYIYIHTYVYGYSLFKSCLGRHHTCLPRSCSGTGGGGAGGGVLTILYRIWVQSVSGTGGGGGGVLGVGGGNVNARTVETCWLAAGPKCIRT